MPRRVVLVPCPFQGHINPMLQLGAILHSRGFSITVAHTQYNSPDPSNHPDFSFLPIPDGLSDGQNFASLLNLVLAANVNCESPLRECLAEKQEQHGDIACIIHDITMYFAEAVANHLKVPSINLVTSNVSTTIAHNAFPSLLEKGHIPLQGSTLHDPVPELHPLRFKDLPISRLGDLEAFFQILVNMYKKKFSSPIIWNTMDCLEQSSLTQRQQQLQVPFFPIGPLHKLAPPSSSSLLEEDSSCITWLDKHSPKSVIYVSWGSLACMDAKDLAEVAWGLANSNQPFLWVVRPGSVRGSQWIEQLPETFMDTVGERCHIVKWAPQKEVLGHRAVGGFWSHCGWNSTLESISEGVPMICRPYSGDQRVNTRYISHVWKVGLELESDELERVEIERAVRRLMVDGEGEEMRQRAMELKEKVDICTSEGGSSNRALKELVEYISSF
ncbi:hypothetical protein VitviT2T_008249 [Vitis vinifera]|uniref:UDP-glucose iridoid glucosyltransferase n=2 Tax=Vitis vinifera TaxID=29760 RepID=A0ABY9C1E0_VITVI|nr:UDP-glucose iridoid glucosyltransferase [Vitis vinifera]WJZ88998.1 hypothetical protein VitviT2T_008249 [Vitis vinifera]|eukprot:XP_010650963.1 PREDICTED: UDP-glucose iridoid glucosyltransferase [Vitis vinifera]